jgi:hypothetical protein
VGSLLHSSIFQRDLLECNKKSIFSPYMSTWQVTHQLFFFWVNFHTSTCLLFFCRPRCPTMRFFVSFLAFLPLSPPSLWDLLECNKKSIFSPYMSTWQVTHQFFFLFFLSFFTPAHAFFSFVALVVPTMCLFVFFLAFLPLYPPSLSCSISPSAPSWTHCAHPSWTHAHALSISLLLTLFPTVPLFGSNLVRFRFYFSLLFFSFFFFFFRVLIFFF